MNQILKMGLALLLGSLGGVLSHALSPAPGHNGSCSYHPLPTMERAVCSKGKERIKYHIQRDSMNMNYGYGEVLLPPIEEGPKPSPPPFGVGDGSAKDVAGQVDGNSPDSCYNSGFHISFCKLYAQASEDHSSYFGPNAVIGRARAKELLFSYYDKLTMRVCWSQTGDHRESRQTGQEGSKKVDRKNNHKKIDPCTDALKLEMAKKQKQGWKCKYTNRSIWDNSVPFKKPKKAERPTGQK
ncbi:MAG: hypothetical protein OXJ52_00770 [Oligoflexia bacterium]|nr:hypothetical protein [Oligoflexia bacterium]